jgi:hypothetical protein
MLHRKLKLKYCIFTERCKRKITLENFQYTFDGVTRERIEEEDQKDDQHQP